MAVRMSALRAGRLFVGIIYGRKLNGQVEWCLATCIHTKSHENMLNARNSFRGSHIITLEKYDNKNVNVNSNTSKHEYLYCPIYFYPKLHAHIFTRHLPVFNCSGKVVCSL
jgi:hypothetical protein